MRKLDCYILPGLPTSLLLPSECVADVLARPKIEALAESKANWMKGHAEWKNQRIPVIVYSALLDSSLDESKKKNAHLVVLNPIPGVVRKAYSGLLCFGKVKRTAVDKRLDYVELPEGVDKRYVEAAVGIDKQTLVIPKLKALGVVFSYV